MFKFKRRLAFLTVPAVLAVGAMSYGSVVAFASPSPSPGPTGTSTPAVEPAESTTAPETAEPNEPAPAGRGYADVAGAQTDTQQEGIN